MATEQDDDDRHRAKIQRLKEQFRAAAGKDGFMNLTEFRKALRTKNEYFTNRLFAMFDKRKEGRIAMDDFITFLLDIRTTDDKIGLLFDLYDASSDGQLDRPEIDLVLKAMVQDSHLKLSDSQVSTLGEIFFEEGLKYSEGGKVTRTGFKNLLLQSHSLSGDVSTLIDIWLGQMEDAVKPEDQSKQKEEEDRIIDIATQARANPTFFSFFGVYVWIVVMLMIAAVILHRKAKDRHGLPNLLLIIARVFGFPLNLLSTMVYVFMLRPLLTSLRGLGAVRYLPLDGNLFFHTTTGCVIFLFAMIHSIAHLCNVAVNIVPDPINYLAQNNLSQDFSGYTPKAEGGNYTYADWILTPTPHLYGTLPGWANPTGVLLCIIISLMLVTSQECVRRRGHFSLFYFFHLEHVPFAVLLLIHAPNFSYFFPIVGVFVALNLLERIIFGRKKTYVIRALLLPSDTVCLVFKKSELLSYNAGDWLSVNIPSIATYEWHAFTISSSPEQHGYMTIHVKAVGSWTRKLKERIQRDFECSKKKPPIPKLKSRLVPHNFSDAAQVVVYNAPQKKLRDCVVAHEDCSLPEMGFNEPIPIYFDGPFSAPSSSIFSAEHAVLIATGIGITPMASILNTILERHLSITHSCTGCGNKWTEETNPSLGQLKKCDFYWIVKDPQEVSWFLDLLTGIEVEQETRGSELPKIVDVHIYITRALAETDMCAVALRTALNLYFHRSRRNIVFGLRSQIIAGRPNLEQLFKTIDQTKIGPVSVFYCGSAIMGDTLQTKCEKYKFKYHREVF